MELQNITKRLKEHDGTRITEKELRAYVQGKDYDHYYDIVIKLTNNKIIAPVKSSGSNGMRPPLHKRYTIIKQECKYDELIPEIRMLHGRLNIEGYLAAPERYKSHRQLLILIDSFLKKYPQSLEIPLSINERSFQIFQREKALKENRTLAAILHFNKGLEEVLNFYPAPEPFFTYNIGAAKAESRQEPTDIKQILNILIIENKDTWHTLRNRLKQNCNGIGGIYFDSLIYGEGKKICRKIDSLTEFDNSYFKGAKTQYYYFGDMDYEGIGIACELINTNPKLEIKLMKPLYKAMLEASKNISLPETKEKQIKKSVEWFVSLFEEEYKTLIKSILEGGRYIPQEILNNGDFIRIIHREWDAENGQV